MKIELASRERARIAKMLAEANVPAEPFWDRLNTDDFSIDCSLVGEVEHYISEVKS